MKFKRFLTAVVAFVLVTCTSPSAYAASTVKGDANGDGVMNVRDAAYIASYLAQGKSLPAICDYNGDGTVNIRDAATIAKTLVILSDPTNIEMLRMVNEVRANAGVAPLTLNVTMCEMADVRAEEITTYFSHTRPDGTDCWTVGEEFGMSFYGENIAAGNFTVGATMDQWINSEGHYRNMINSSYTQLGVGYNNAPGTLYRYYWVQIFR